MVDGDPMRSSNIAAYINSVSIPRSLQHMMGRRREPNVDFVFVDGCPKSAEKFPVAVRQQYPMHLEVQAIRTIRVGEELLARYDL